ncbi:AAA family ATPase [Streptococcus parauberis]|uniref:AAA family ATPase n=1 Tax=Streptococcus parauberis TaxID=1348 RepID=UPI000789B7C4|nr:AAA family ATPase [Streptococcus parauberis]KYP21848.1 DNA replication and repair protein RecF [Streptococcus parauberis]KYP21934.1 DNA replication and repair protein RecF [Streptococcus parauberis]KYP23740.1 DNA replication and repair protein RecF [Streptococcus parauberis]KYP25347.1 DNA replication and repair protein RecF [Streptococcus parauberis]KYP28658.1 DNA replication and repair protein RecF [Streptococcus parauberis]
MAVTINKLEIENVKRIKAVKIEPSPKGLTIIGGNNNQGKTSVLDSIAWALGGGRYEPSKPMREGSAVAPTLKVTMSNGLIVERKGVNSALKVIDPDGRKAGQQLLNSFVEELAINLPKFMDGTPKEKADTLLQIIGVGDQLVELELKEKEVYNQRHAIGVIADQKEKFAKEQPYFTDAPKELISISELIQQQQTILAKNGENAQKRTRVEQIRYEYDQSIIEVDRLRKLLAEAEAKTEMLSNDLKIANTDVMELHDQSTAEIEDNIAQIDEINRKVRANLDKDKAEEDAKQQREQYALLSTEIERIRQAKRDLLTNANLPLEGLSVDEGKLLYQGQEWDNMSGSQQLMVATAIVRKLKPNCGFVLIDKLEQMDNNTLQEFGAWLEQEGLQAIATRVSTGDECSIIIEDGYSIENENYQPVAEPKKWDF